MLFSILIISHLFFFKLRYSLILPIAVIVLILTYFKSNIFKIPKEIWIKFGIILGKIINPVICFILYFLVIGATRIILDLFNKKLIIKKSNVFFKSNWRIRNDKSYLTLDDQF